MRCQNCGAENQSGNFCIRCGSKLEYSPVDVDIQKPPLSTMVMALICFTVCWPLGLASTILMVHSRDAFFTGDMSSFAKNNKASKVCSIVGFVLTGIAVLIWLIAYVMIFMALVD